MRNVLRCLHRNHFLAVIGPALFFATAVARSDDAKSTRAIDRGQRVFSCGHSFHVFVPGILNDLAKSAGINDHVQVGMSGIGGSRIIQHWDVAAEKNKAKDALRSGNVDGLTLSPIFLPDDGIANFAELALKHNPNIRITIQEFWMPFDRGITEFPPKDRPKEVDRNSKTPADLREMHADYFK